MSATESVPAGEAARLLVPTLIGVSVDHVAHHCRRHRRQGSAHGHRCRPIRQRSLIGRVILYLPAAIVLVLLPKVSAREAAGLESRDVLAKSLLVTVGFCAVATLAYTVAPSLLVFIAFGSSFEDAAGLLWMFAIAMSGYALLNVLLTYQLARGAYRLSFILLGGALCQLALFGVFNESPEGTPHRVDRSRWWAADRARALRDAGASAGRAECRLRPRWLVNHEGRSTGAAASPQRGEDLEAQCGVVREQAGLGPRSSRRYRGRCRKAVRSLIVTAGRGRGSSLPVRPFPGECGRGPPAALSR